MKSRILFVCIGACGANIGELFEERNYNTMFINSSEDDLNAIKGKVKYHIPTGKGCARVRERALGLAEKYHEEIINEINNNYPKKDVVFFIAGIGGGTGSGLINVLLDTMSIKYPEKSYGAICVLPSKKETPQVQNNAIECYNELVKIDNIKNVFLLDNSSRKGNAGKMQINQEFVDLFDKVVNISKPNKFGVIDKAEAETLLTTKGNSVILSFDIQDDIETSLLDAKEKSIFTPFENVCEYIGLSIKDEDCDLEDIQDNFGIVKDMYVGYNDDQNILILSGMPYPDKSIEDLIQNVLDKRDKIYKGNENDLNFNVPIEKKVEKKQEIDLDSVLNKYFKRR